MRKTAIALVAVVGVFAAQAASAQTTTANASASITINELLEINVTNTTVAFDAPTFGDFTTGHIGANGGGSVIQTRGNVVHRVTVGTPDANMDYTGDFGVTKPVGDFQWALNAGAFSGLTAGATVVENLARAGTLQNRGTVTYRMLLDAETDQPGTYALDFVYTVVAQ